MKALLQFGYAFTFFTYVESVFNSVQVILQRPRAYGQPGQEAEGGADGGDDSHGYREERVSAER